MAWFGRRSDLRQARRLNDAAKAFHAEGRYLESIAASEEVIAGFEGRSDSRIGEQIARAKYGRACSLGALGRGAEAITGYAELIDEFGDDPFVPRGLLASALLNMGTQLARAGRYDEALSVHRETVERFAADELPAIRATVAKAFLSQAGELSDAGRHEEALDLLVGFLRKYEASDLPDVGAALAAAAVNVAMCLFQLERYSEAIRAADDAVRRFSADEDPRARAQLAGGLVVKACSLRGLGRRDEEMAVCDRIVEQYDRTIDPDTACMVSSAMIQKAQALADADRSVEALATFEEARLWLADRSFDTRDNRLAQTAVAALNAKGCVLMKLERWDGALSAFEEAKAENDGVEAPDTEQLAALLMSNRAEALARLGRCDEALAACDEVERRLETVKVELDLRSEIEATRRICAGAKGKKRAPRKDPA